MIHLALRWTLLGAWLCVIFYISVSAAPTLILILTYAAIAIGLVVLCFIVALLIGIYTEPDSFYNGKWRRRK